MTIDETKQVLHKISSVYIYAFTNKTTDEKRQILNDWVEALKDESFEEIQRNLNKYINSNKYAPSISDLKTQNKTSSKFNNYEQSEKCTKEEWDNMVDLYNRYYHKDIKVGKLVDEYLKGVNEC